MQQANSSLLSDWCRHLLEPGREDSFKKGGGTPGVGRVAFNSPSWEVEAEESQCVPRPAWSTEGVPGQPEQSGMLHRETLTQKTKNKEEHLTSATINRLPKQRIHEASCTRNQRFWWLCGSDRTPDRSERRQERIYLIG